jgi:flagellar biosynthesis protein FlhG
VDQAQTLRRIGNTGGSIESIRKPNTGAKVIAVTSGKGGVGKTNIAANLAYLFSKMGKKVLLLDADAGLANIDVLLGISPHFNLYHLFRGEKTLPEIAIKGPGGMIIIPAASGIQQMADLSAGQKLTLVEELDNYNEKIDVMIIDTAAGITGNVMYFNTAARDIIVVISPDPTSLTDSYALIKILSQGYAVHHFKVLANMVKDAGEAFEVYKRLSGATNHFLNVSVGYLGYVTRDRCVSASIKQQSLFAEIYPSSRASRLLAAIADEIWREESRTSGSRGMIKFFGDAVVDRDD